MKKILMFFFITLGFLYSQRNPSPLLIESNIVYTDSVHNVYISFRLPYKYLFFVKENYSYTAGLSFTTEVLDKENETLIVRETSYQNITANSYKDTESNKLTIEGIIEVQLKSGKYLIDPIVSLENTNRSFKLDPFELVIEEEPPLMNYVVVDNSDSSVMPISNYGGSIPIGLDRKDLVIIVANPNIETFPISIDNNNLLSELSADYLGKGGYSIIRDKNNTIFSIDDKGSYSFFRIKDVNFKFKEYEIILEVNSGKLSDTLSVPVILTNKPESLINPKYALELISIGYGEETSRKLLREDEEDYERLLREFWDSKSKNEGINLLEYEYYRRCDYASYKFGNSVNKNGVYSDRGKTFVKLGKPDDVKRYYNDRKEAVEVWYYKASGNSFVFIDNSGLGDYKLKK